MASVYMCPVFSFRMKGGEGVFIHITYIRAVFGEPSTSLPPGHLTMFREVGNLNLIVFVVVVVVVLCFFFFF